jgi:hypothetical protein
VFVLVGDVVDREEGKQTGGKPDPGMYPDGTAFALLSPSLIHVLSAAIMIHDY